MVTMEKDSVTQTTVTVETSYDRDNNWCRQNDQLQLLQTQVFIDIYTYYGNSTCCRENSCLIMLMETIVAMKTLQLL